jgi:polyisoprenoid-binding protein YceI
MKKFLLSAIALFLLVTASFAQKIGTKDAKVAFDATSSVENIKAVNNSGQVVVNTSSGDVAARVLIKNFIFKQSLMQEHFNENYMESTKYPNSTLKGKISNLSEVKFGTDGTYKAKITGTLEMHGVTKNVEIPATITVKGDKTTFKSDFKIACADYNIAIPSLVADKVAKEVKISIEGALSNQ